MPHILPSRGLRYSPVAGELSNLLAPPYDVISPAQQAELGRRSPHNAVHLELAGGGDERYQKVAGLLADWTSSGALVRDSEPTLYVYEQEFTEAGTRYSRKALIAGVEAQPWEEGAVKPHEFTMSGPKEDRLKLLEATRTQFSPVFMVARDRAGQLRQFIEATIASSAPAAEATTPDGDTHRIWTVEAGRGEMRMLAPLFAESFYIADGHHRYETALNYRQRLAENGPLSPDHPARFALTAIVAADDPGLVIRSIHRIVPEPAPYDWEQRLSPLFEIVSLKEVGIRADQVRELTMLLESEPRAIIAIGLDPTTDYILRIREGALEGRLPEGRTALWGSIPPNILRYGVLTTLWDISDADLTAGRVEYTHDLEDTYEAVSANAGACGFLLAPVGMGDVMAIADGGERMPQKSTFFYPKLGTGLVFHPLEP